MLSLTGHLSLQEKNSRKNRKGSKGVTVYITLKGMHLIILLVYTANNIVIVVVVVYVTAVCTFKCIVQYGCCLL